MNNVIPVYNQILKVTSESGLSNKIKLPKIAVVGNQSCGKSSVLESIAERDYLPSGDGLVTKCPIVNQFICEETPRPYVVFDHKPDEKFYDFDKVREEINDRSSELTKDGQITVFDVV